MPLVLGGLLVGVGVILPLFILMGMHSSAASWIRPLFRALDVAVKFNPVARIPLVGGWLQSGASWAYHKVRHEVSHALVASLAPLAKWLAALAMRVVLMNNALVYLAEDAVQALSHLRHHTMPREIVKRVAPVKAQAIAAERVGTLADARVKGEEKARRRSISLDHAAWVAALAALGVGIDRLERLHLGARVKRAERAIATTIPRSLARIRGRLVIVERRTTKAAIAAAVVATIARRFPWLFCRNVSKVAKRICRMNPKFIDDLLGIGLAFLAVVDPLIIAKTAVKSEQLLDYAVRELADPPALATEASKVLADLLVGGVD